MHVLKQSNLKGINDEIGTPAFDHSSNFPIRAFQCVSSTMSDHKVSRNVTPRFWFIKIIKVAEIISDMPSLHSYVK